MKLIKTEDEQDTVGKEFYETADMTITIKRQETLEEVAEKYAKGKSSSSVFQEAHKRDFIEGANYQAERMYSEADEIMKFLDAEKELKLSDAKTIERIKWYFKTYFEQFKKK